jgi:hypothetical protein
MPDDKYLVRIKFGTRNRTYVLWQNTFSEYSQGTYQSDYLIELFYRTEKFVVSKIKVVISEAIVYKGDNIKNSYVFIK